jgi:hypothetical protein
MGLAIMIDIILVKCMHSKGEAMHVRYGVQSTCGAPSNYDCRENHATHHPKDLERIR